ncbi:SLC13 family permease [Halocalculus aciditolerans]|uniref:Potassium transporter TrkA n=1 Tax=Halocalculus aciditolerans TaxID=1383812 RepID=A0A830F9B0_9EURY|nr:SLC13 family permease [Halocalculus aciditolerans]GGL52582.1 potassium transporter TrkA [Halocalculus aciditolerans]
MVVPPVTTGTLVVFALIAVALVLFVTEVVPSDFTAIGVLVALAVLEPYTGVPAADAIAGFASPATVTILAMYILSEGVQQTGIVERLGVYLARLTGGDETRLLAATIGTTGLSAGIVNNTPVVAVFIPMVTGLAERARISPSKLLLPLSYAAMLGGTLTLIGTATNLLASDFAREIPGRGPIGMFEFTPLGVLVFIVGAAYLLTVGRRLTPERVPPLAALTEEFAVDRHLVRFGVPEDSALVGRGVDAFHEELDAQGADADLLQVERDGEGFHAQSSDQTLAAGDVLTFRATARTADRLLDQYGLSQPRAGDVSDDDLVTDASTVAEAVVLPDSALVGETPASAELDVRYDTTVLAVQRGDDLLRDAVETVELRAGDTLLLHATPAGVDHLQARGDVSVTHVPEGELDLLEPDADEADVAPLSAKTPVAVGIVAVVVGLAALGVVPIVIAALGGVVAMVVTGCLAPADAYDAVSWNIVFLLAGVLPLGVAMQRTGGAAVVAGLLVESAHVLPIIAVLGLFYVLTGLFANVITPVASVVLMSPIAIDTATRVDADPFAFLLAVTFAASAAFMTPIGYQTNLMVYGPGGYRFTDYVRVGGPLQLLLAVVVTLAIPAFFGL